MWHILKNIWIEMSHILMLDKPFLLQYMKECFIKRCVIPVSKKILSLLPTKRTTPLRKLKFFYIPTKLMKCCH